LELRSVKFYAYAGRKHCITSYKERIEPCRRQYMEIWSHV